MLLSCWPGAKLDFRSTWPLVFSQYVISAGTISIRGVGRTLLSAIKVTVGFTVSERDSFHIESELRLRVEKEYLTPTDSEQRRGG